MNFIQSSTGYFLHDFGQDHKYASDYSSELQRTMETRETKAN